jgi:hypothetical protein
VSATTHLLRPHYGRQWLALAVARFSTVMLVLNGAERALAGEM